MAWRLSTTAPSPVNLELGEALAAIVGREAIGHQIAAGMAQLIFPDAVFLIEGLTLALILDRNVRVEDLHNDLLRPPATSLIQLHAIRGKFISG